MPHSHIGMCALVLFHLSHDGTRLRILNREALKMTGQMRLDLPLCFSQKTEVPTVANLACSDPKNQRPAIPQRIEQTRPPTEFPDTRACPSQMLDLFVGSVSQRFPKRRITTG